MTHHAIDAPAFEAHGAYLQAYPFTRSDAFPVRLLLAVDAADAARMRANWVDEINCLNGEPS